MATDPVCGMAVAERAAELTLVRDGRTYYFCSSACRDEYADPERSQRSLALRLAVAWPCALAVVVLTYAIRAPWAGYAELALATAVQFYPGLTFYAGSLDGLRGRVANMDLLVAFGSTLAFGYSALVLLLPGRLPSIVFFDASAMIVTLILTGHALEARTRRHAASAVLALGRLLPSRVRVLRAGLPRELSPGELEVGDVATVPAGARFPADGRVVRGRSEADESLLTGESRPIPKGPGDRVLAGAQNGLGPLEVEVTQTGEGTFLAQVGRLLHDAESARLPLRRTADRIAGAFVPIVLAIGVAAAIFWTAAGAGFAIALLVLVSVTITACPCAFGLATPAAILVGTGRAAESGILFRGGDALQRAAAVDMVLLDKTGTLTDPIPRVAEIRPVGAWDRRELLALAAGLEGAIEHPFARAVVRAAREQGVAPIAVGDVRVVEGGVEGRWGDRPIAIRRAIGRAPDRASEASEGGLPASPPPELSWSVVEIAGERAGWIGCREGLVPGAREAVEELERAGIPVALVTGDTPASAAAAARAAGIAEVHAGMSPAGKLEVLAEKRAAGRSVAFVGDGINDAPVLAAADLGIALGSGTEVAREAGQVLLVRSELGGVPAALAAGRRTVAKVRQNLFWALAYNALLLPVAAGVLVPVTGLGIFQALPIAGALAMGASSTLVLTNSLTMRRGLLRLSGAPAFHPARAPAPG
jgi:P-type Cu+ transporter